MYKNSIVVSATDGHVEGILTKSVILDFLVSQV
jgi:hypothetical protein